MADPTCSVNDCTRPVRARGWCVTHYERWRQHGDVDVLLVQRNPSECVVDACTGKATRRGYCTKHYQRWRTHGDVTARFPGAQRACGTKDCARPHYARGWCKLHYKRWWKTGNPVGLLPHFSPLAGKAGAANPMWRGGDVGYTGVHLRLRAEYGPASDYECEHCGGEARDWAYNHDDPNERVDPVQRLVYSTGGRDFYLPLCCLCHGRFDAAWRASRAS